MPVLEMDLAPGETIISRGGRTFLDDQFDRDTTSTQYGGGGGMFGAFKRAVSGGTLFMTEYKANGSPGQVAFATKVPDTFCRFR